jgi:hypothetical protein
LGTSGGLFRGKMPFFLPTLDIKLLEFRKVYPVSNPEKLIIGWQGGIKNKRANDVFICSFNTSVWFFSSPLF